MEHFPEPAPNCKCSRTEIRRVVSSNGAIRFVHQCLNCGNGKPIAKADVAIPLSQVKPFDQSIKDNWKKRWDGWRQRNQHWYETAKEREEMEFRQRYNEHLKSEKWFAIRRKVIARCNNICEGCGERPVQHIHHLTYARLGNEMLFDLVGVCKRCHYIIHPDMEDR